MRLLKLITAFALLICIAVTPGCDDDTSAASETSPISNSTSPSPSPSLSSASSSDQNDQSNDIKNLSDAIKYALPTMGDTQETFSDGAQDLVLWAQDRIEWKELAAVASTKPALVMKDSDDQLGKRICASGQIIEISANEVAGKVYVGELANMDSGNIFRFIALRSTGDLVEQSNARFCGIVTGKVNYSNSMGGESHAIQLVGMFDLPDNHKPIGED